MNRGLILFLLTVFLVLLIASSQSEYVFLQPHTYKEINSLIVFANNEEKNFPCIQKYDLGYDNRTIVIDSRDEYLKLFQDYKIENEMCSSGKLQSIDFKENTLLGQFKIGGCGESSFDKKFLRSDYKKQVKYVVERHKDDICDGMYPTMNWVLVDKIPKDFTISFKYKD